LLEASEEAWAEVLGVVFYICIFGLYQRTELPSAMLYSHLLLGNYGLPNSLLLQKTHLVSLCDRFDVAFDALSLVNVF
jgi:hypothetical protein